MLFYLTTCTRNEIGKYTEALKNKNKSRDIRISKYYEFFAKINYYKSKCKYFYRVK